MIPFQKPGWLFASGWLAVAFIVLLLSYVRLMPLMTWQAWLVVTFIVLGVFIIWQLKYLLVRLMYTFMFLGIVAIVFEWWIVTAAIGVILIIISLFKAAELLRA